MNEKECVASRSINLNVYESNGYGWKKESENMKGISLVLLMAYQPSRVI